MKNLLFLGIVILSGVFNVQSKEIDIDSDRNIKFPPKGDLISVNDLQNDVAELKSLLLTVHPNPSFTMNIAEVELQLNKLTQAIVAPMTQIEAWKHLSLMNPFFNDGHMVITYPEYYRRLSEHMDNGGRLFPLQVRIDKSQNIYVTGVENVDGNIRVGDKIAAINGVTASEIVGNILNRMHGDTASNLRAFGAERFAKMYWLLYGDTGYYQVDIDDNSELRRYSITGSNKKTGRENSDISDFVQRKILKDDIGYIRIDRFYYSPEQEEPFFNFMKESWLEFRDANVQDVIIDVRNNPGGTDHYWQIGIAPYVAQESFSFLSRFKIRMTERNIRLGPFKGELGTLVEGSYDELIPVEELNDLRIPGKAYLLMGPLSYSSTVLFLTAFQDSHQAVIAGDSSGARSCTTGRIQTSIFGGSKLELTMPTAIFTRPAGQDLCKESIKPDILILDEPSDPNIAVTKLAKSIIDRR
ncbi:S41 family peptidase [Aliiglaciecola sp. LCG003]|uniref:S41 family peptidase n=1 Tax=Aliiglaciecola sp. LCG003 TaxID=3053655 RepID=UPI00257475CF|nr:S41 family peptidase [Aliiglaciecola sp. LCG003]WJG07898.1 S41 family peptidase [Aliiglaciecola sp. LCG003]